MYYKLYLKQIIRIFVIIEYEWWFILQLSLFLWKFEIFWDKNEIKKSCQSKHVKLYLHYEN